ncbi:polysaccharide deacetylase [Palleronia sp. LCG004]|uniref:polysaccharide deacetylase family protein n=1 Tax=Palleronia sp. LCG004 TaxID=3079304 RepID=UPI002943CEC7|nr:polysaccharide deacetylase [Palleronia sp. LCG004]WOI56578.1 polysaccharide deacetylase [Palleronia sp. LCG004]
MTPKVHCALTFDFDAMSVWIGSYASRNPSMISRGEFGAVAVPRILDLLRRHGLPASFCVTGHTALAYPDLVRRIAAEGHELVHHGWVHENPADFSEADERRNLEKGFEAIDKAAGLVPRGYRSPSWDFSERTVRILVDSGMTYDSSLMGSDLVPYYVRSGDAFPNDAPYVFGVHTDLVELPVAWHLDDFPHFEYDGATKGLSAPSTVLEIWKDEVSWAADHEPGGLLTFTMHPQVIGRGHRLAMLETFVSWLKSRGDVGFTRMIDHADRWKSANPLGEWLAQGSVHARTDGLG